ncbi:MAG: 50S ribosomal protein L7/L12 [Flavobacteriales bacterium]|nr:MAG: 50S ribosomal protein L7/L12 [Flavobacteriales bacterium]
MNEKLKNIINELKELTLIEAAMLVKEMENVFGIDLSTNISNVSTNTTSTLTEKTEKIEEKTNFEVVLNEVPTDKRISTLKVVRNITGLGLKESKEIVDSVPKSLKQGITKEEAENIKKELESVGAIVIIK